MHRLVNLAGVLGACSAILHAQPRPAASSSIVETRSVTLPAYTSSPRIAQFIASADDYAKQVNDPGFAMQRLTYRSDGLAVFAYLYRPVNLPTDRRLPVVIFNRGSYVRDDFSYEVLAVANQLAHEGYVTIAPMLRGSGGAAGVDEMGGADLHDIFNVLPVVRELPYVDASRIVMYGESRGGIMTLMVARDGLRWVNADTLTHVIVADSPDGTDFRKTLGVPRVFRSVTREPRRGDKPSPRL